MLARRRGRSLPLRELVDPTDHAVIRAQKSCTVFYGTLDPSQRHVTFAAEVSGFDDLGLACGGRSKAWYARIDTRIQHSDDDTIVDEYDMLQRVRAKGPAQPPEPQEESL